MALNMKYAALPDLDSAPDIYETPSLTDDNSTTAPTGTARSQSPSSDYQDFSDDNEGVEGGISRSRLHPSDARSRFEPARVDARDVDFSDRVNGKRKSYKASSRRRADKEELGDFSDEEEGGEGLERKLARLKREVEEVRAEMSRREREKGATVDGESDDRVAVLSRLLDDISAGGANAGASARSRLVQALDAELPATPAKVAAESVPSETSGEAASYVVRYAPSYNKSHALAKAADFDTRLTQLEKSLGITPGSSLDITNPELTVLPTLATLERQLAVLSTSTPSSLDAISRRVRSLTQEADRLDEARRAAKSARDALRAAGGGEGVVGENGEAAVDEEQNAKINALYGTLATIESLAPVLPGLLERLRSLRTIHAEAAGAGERLEMALRRQEEMAADIKRWKEAVEGVEAAVREGEVTIKGNVEVVEGWVKELEGRVGKLGA